MKAKSGKRDKWQFSFTPILRYNLVFCAMILMTILLGGMVFCLTKMRDRTDAAVSEIQPRIEYRIEQSKNLLLSLASMEDYADPEISVEKKVAGLDRVNTYFGYFMIRYVDEDINVHSTRGATSLASRDYMQRLYSTGEVQVTDSFEAGTDGVTLNYTVAVPIIREGHMAGSIFCAIYFDEIVNVLKESSYVLGTQGALLGSQNQVMSSTQELEYGNSYLDELKKGRLFRSNAGAVETALLNHGEGKFWSIRGANLYYTKYVPVAGTNWKIVSTIGFWETYQTLLPIVLAMMALCVLLFAMLLLIIKRYVQSQLLAVDMLVQSVQELERKIYQDSRPEDVNLDDIIYLTSTGLSDGLTGVVTRTVFLSQLKGILSKQRSQKLLALCFVDLDDLKKLNDTYGHEAGDIALKTIGYVLREYEKKYDGLVGRYGGDEFILVLTDIDSEQELTEVLDELALRLHSVISHGEHHINIKCSIGVAVWNGSGSTDALIKQADEALYFVKQNGKGYYKIYQE